MKPGGQNVLVEIVCSTKECNIRTQQNSTDSRLLIYTHNCFSVSFRNAQDYEREIKYLKDRLAVSFILRSKFLLGPDSGKPLQDTVGREHASVHLMDKGQSVFSLAKLNKCSGPVFKN